MKKSILKILIAIIITSLILLFFVGCKSPDTSEFEERLEKLELEEKIEELEDELAEKEAEEAAMEEEEKPAEDITEMEEMDEEEDAEEESGDTDPDADADADKEAPTISLAVYAGPTLDGSICYYRVEATVTGKPGPTVSFSKDDSGGSWGSKKVQININNPGDTYNLTATATNSEGSATASITLDWGCAIPTPDPVIKNVEIAADNDLSGWIVVDFAAWTGFNKAYVGDSAINSQLDAYLSFDIDDLGDINGIIIKHVSVSIPIDEVSGHPESWAGSAINIAIIDYGPSLELGDQNLGGSKSHTVTATNSLTNLDFSSYKVESKLKEAVDIDKKWFQLRIKPGGILANSIGDFYTLITDDITLNITYEVP